MNDPRFEDGLRQRLFEQRTVVARGWLDGADLSDLSAQLLTLDALGDEDITFRLDSFGCDVDAALTLVDTLGVVGVEVEAIASGRLAGAAVAVLAVCDRRLVMPHAVADLRQPDHRFSARRPAELAEAARVATARLQLLCQRMTTTADQAAELASAFERGRILDAESLLGAGLADEVVRPTLGFGRPAARG